MSNTKILLKKYFDEHSVVESNIESFNNFVDHELQKIIEENNDIEPTIIPHNIDEFKIRFDKVWLTKPEITEADGSKRSVYPIEARLRKITYSAPCYIDISAHINGVQRETFTTHTAKNPKNIKKKWGRMVYFFKLCFNWID